MGSRSKSNRMHGEMSCIPWFRVTKIAEKLGWTVKRFEELQRGATPSVRERKEWSMHGRLLGIGHLQEKPQ